MLIRIQARRELLEHPTPVPACAYFGGPSNTPAGWFVVERWELGRAAARGSACAVGWLMAVANGQGSQDASLTPKLRGAIERLEPSVDDRVIEPFEEHGGR